MLLFIGHKVTKTQKLELNQGVPITINENYQLTYIKVHKYPTKSKVNNHQKFNNQ